MHSNQSDTHFPACSYLMSVEHGKSETRTPIARSLPLVGNHPPPLG